MTYYYYALTSSIAGKGFLKLKKISIAGTLGPCVLACADLFSGLPPPPPFSFFFTPKPTKILKVLKTWAPRTNWLRRPSISGSVTISRRRLNVYTSTIVCDLLLHEMYSFRGRCRFNGCSIRLRSFSPQFWIEKSVSFLNFIDLARTPKVLHDSQNVGREESRAYAELRNP